MKYKLFVHRFDGFFDKEFDTRIEAVVAGHAMLKGGLCFSVHRVDEDVEYGVESVYVAGSPKEVGELHGW